MTKHELIAALTDEKAQPSFAFDRAVAEHARLPFLYFTSQLQLATQLVPPGFFWTAGVCALTGHATIGPDYNGPLRAALLRQFPEAEWHNGVSFDLAPGGAAFRACLALCAACVWADCRDWQASGRVYHLEPLP